MKCYRSYQYGVWYFIVFRYLPSGMSWHNTCWDSVLHTVVLMKYLIIDNDNSAKFKAVLMVSATDDSSQWKTISLKIAEKNVPWLSWKTFCREILWLKYSSSLPFLRNRWWLSSHLSKVQNPAINLPAFRCTIFWCFLWRKRRFKK